MIYVLGKNDFNFVGRYNSLKQAKELIAAKGVKEDECIFAEECGVKYISRITFVDGECVYKNPKWWNEVAPTITEEDYENHEVKDIIGNTVSYDRFTRELYYNTNRIAEIDKLSGQILYDTTVGFEFVALFREECVETEFDYSTGVSPLTIWAKMEHVNIPKEILTHNADDAGLIIEVNILSMINAGCFREAAQALTFVEPDIFLTEERINKYKSMLNSADAIDYSTTPTYYMTGE